MYSHLSFTNLFSNNLARWKLASTAAPLPFNYCVCASKKMALGRELDDERGTLKIVCGKPITHPIVIGRSCFSPVTHKPSETSVGRKKPYSKCCVLNVSRHRCILGIQAKPSFQRQCSLRPISEIGVTCRGTVSKAPRELCIIPSLLRFTLDTDSVLGHFLEP